LAYTALLGVEASLALLTPKQREQAGYLLDRQAE
jgi:hypothetical protein